MPEDGYLLGHDEGEVRRLELQGRIVGPGTERMLRAAGVGPGMHVLDIGAGAGDVAMIAARLVGPSGSVLGIDRGARVLERARHRAEAAGLRRIRYEAATLDMLPADRAFDAVVGRYVLMHQSDRAGFLRSAARRLRPGGTLVFIEPDLPEVKWPRTEAGHRWSIPPVPVFDEAADLSVIALALAGLACSTGGEFTRLFHEAGLPRPELLQETPLGNAGSPLVEWLCLSLQGLMPVLEEHGVTTADAIGLETLPARIHAALSNAHSQIRLDDLVGASARIA